VALFPTGQSGRADAAAMVSKVLVDVGTLPNGGWDQKEFSMRQVLHHELPAILNTYSSCQSSKPIVPWSIIFFCQKKRKYLN